MLTEEFEDYKVTMKNHLMDLHQTRINKQKIFARDVCGFYKIQILTAFVDFLDNYYIFTTLDAYDDNIIEYCSLINFMELTNKILKTNYKPTFLLDVSNNQSIINGGY